MFFPHCEKPFDCIRLHCDLPLTKMFQLEHFIEIYRSKRNYNHKNDCDLNIFTNFIECLANLCNPSNNRSHIIHISWAQACAMHAWFFGLQAINCVHSSEMNLIGHVYHNVCLWSALNFNEHRTEPKSFMFELCTANERHMLSLLMFWNVAIFIIQDISQWFPHKIATIHQKCSHSTVFDINENEFFSYLNEGGVAGSIWNSIRI